MTVPITPVLVGDFEGDQNPLTTDGARDAFIKVNANIAALDALNVPRRVYWVYGDSTDGGTTPDATTQASIDALVAAGIPEANIRWLYEVSVASGTFTIADMAAASNVDNIVLVQASGDFTIDGLTSASSIDVITLTTENTFIIAPLDSATTIDQITLVLASGEFTVNAVTSSVTIDNITITDDFDPTSITGLELWYDQSDITTLWTDDGTTQVSSGGDLVYRWDDKSGNAGHARQSGTSTLRPTYQTIGIQFDGGDHLDQTSHLFTPDTYTAFVVFRCANDEGGWAWMLANTAVDDEYTAQAVAAADGSLQHVKRNGAFEAAVTSTTGHDDSATHVMTGQEISTSSRSVWVDGAGNGTNSATVTNPTLTEFAIGTANDSTPSGIFVGYIMEILIYDTVLDATNRGNVESYLSTKWGIS